MRGGGNERLANSELRNERVTLVQENVLGFDVAMHHVVAMRVIQMAACTPVRIWQKRRGATAVAKPTIGPACTPEKNNAPHN